MATPREDWLDADVEEERTLADELLDDLLPPEFDWRGVVRRHPIPALLVALAGGYWLGHTKGREIVGALSDLASAEISTRVGALGGEAEDPG